MEVLRGEDSGEVAETWASARVKQYQATSLFLPAGETPKALYARWRRNPPPYLSTLQLCQVDDITDGPGQGQFARFFREELPDFTVAPPAASIRADLAILGFGPNGHIAFHEPYLPADFAFGPVALENETARRLNLPEGTHGITYGAGAFLACKAILLLVKGEAKRAAWERFRAGDPSLPASALRHHADLSVWTDL